LRNLKDRVLNATPSIAVVLVTVITTVMIAYILGIG
jgi:hypothetical protein